VTARNPATAPAHPGWHRATGLALAACTLVWAVLVWNAPLDSVQGVVQKILYVHPPCAFAAYLGFFVTAAAGALYLWQGDPRWDRLALSSAEVGVLFCTLMLLTGPIWAKATWGRWWSWDLRLTLTLLLYLIYIAYLLLRSFTEGSERTARFASVYGIAGAAIIPLNYFAIDMAGGRSIHPENLQRGSLGAGMAAPFAMAAVTVIVAYFALLFRRMEVADLREALARREAEAADARGEATSWDT